MDARDLLALAVIASLDGMILVWLRRRARRRDLDRNLSRMLRIGLRLLARA
jgi:hypothetical protein